MMAYGACQTCGSAVEECTCDHVLRAACYAAAHEWHTFCRVPMPAALEAARNVFAVLSMLDDMHAPTSFEADARRMLNMRVIQQRWPHETDVNDAIARLMVIVRDAGYATE